MKRNFNSALLLICIIGCSAPAKHNLKKPDFIRDCRNVKIVRNHAIAACGNLLIIEDLKTSKRKEFSSIDSKLIEADDIAVAGDFLFTISMNDHMKMYDILTPMNPVFVDSKEDIPVQLYTGIDASNGLVVTSGGLRDSYIVRYTTKGFKQKVDLVSSVEKYFGRPDVLIWKSKELRELKLIHSVDISLTYKWGINISEYDKDEYVTKKIIELKSGFDPIILGDYQPANFPITAIQINNFLYYSHWKSKSIYRLNLKKKNAIQEVVYQSKFIVSHMASDGKNIFMVNLDTKNFVYKLNIKSKKIFEIKSRLIQLPIGIAAKNGYVAIADKLSGLVVLKY
jgi:hypothetical protein